MKILHFIQCLSLSSVCLCASLTLLQTYFLLFLFYSCMNKTKISERTEDFMRSYGAEPANWASVRKFLVWPAYLSSVSFFVPPHQQVEPHPPALTRSAPQSAERVCLAATDENKATFQSHINQRNSNSQSDKTS